MFQSVNIEIFSDVTIACICPTVRIQVQTEVIVGVCTAFQFAEPFIHHTETLAGAVIIDAIRHYGHLEVVICAGIEISNLVIIE
jgi:hypothetical protein